MMTKIRYPFLSILTILFLLTSNFVFAQGPGQNDSAIYPDPQATIPTDGTAQHRLYLPVLKNRSPFPSIFGVEMSSLQPNRGLAKMVQAGAYWVRRNGVMWSEVEPVKGERNWSAMAHLDVELSQAAAHGAQVILIVRGTPGWARKYPGSDCGPMKKTEISSFALFMRDLVARYSVAPYNVKYWEIWNEPDAPMVNTTPMPDGWTLPYGCWGDSSDLYYGGRFYASVLKQVYPAMKAADPEAQILTGGLLLDCYPQEDALTSSTSSPQRACYSSNFLEGILISGGKNFFDGVSFHAYDFYNGILGQYSNVNWNSSWDTTGPSLRKKVDFIRGILEKYGASEKYLMNTEVALLCNDPCTDTVNFEITKSYQLVQSTAVAIMLNLRSNVWYDLYGGWRNSGLLYSDGTSRPAFQAYQFVHRKLADAAYTNEFSKEGVKAFEFRSETRKIWLLWSLDGKKHLFTLPSTPKGAWDSSGTPVAANTYVEVGMNPIYVEWNP